ncbi:hypothetical protein AK812_SmicGene67 [Symbiodinium microadriaticum]|uniref:Uncharacterized protein n=1 Tax=Symbiodinium microadriaticum TaxID=2951 RepID=A0A1Q9F7T4_SYMMI|nr:hypothetical protein AK812_SmicGene67 [Symbiodinium microadriaticum]
MPADILILKQHEPSDSISMNDNYDDKGDGNSLGGDDPGVVSGLEEGLIVADCNVGETRFPLDFGCLQDDDERPEGEMPFALLAGAGGDSAGHPVNYYIFVAPNLASPRLDSRKKADKWATDNGVHKVTNQLRNEAKANFDGLMGHAKEPDELDPVQAAVSEDPAGEGGPEEVLRG